MIEERERVQELIPAMFQPMLKPHLNKVHSLPYLFFPVNRKNYLAIQYKKLHGSLFLMVNDKTIKIH